MMASSISPALESLANDGIKFLILTSIIITAVILIVRWEDHGVTIPTLSASIIRVGITALFHYVNRKVRLICMFSGCQGINLASE